MSTVNTTVEIIIAIFVIYYLIKKYNTLSCYREPVRKAWADIDTYREQKQNTLQRLYEVANQFSQQEQNIHMQASLAHMPCNSANFQALGRAYPELKTNQTYLSLMRSIESLEGNIQHSRQNYNDAVSRYQMLRSQIPYCFLAPLFGFKTAQYNRCEEEIKIVNAMPSSFSQRNQKGEAINEIVQKKVIIVQNVMLSCTQRLENMDHTGTVKIQHAKITSQIRMVSPSSFLVPIATRAISVSVP